MLRRVSRANARTAANRGVISVELCSSDEELRCLLGMLGVRGPGRAAFRRAVSALLAGGMTSRQALEQVRRSGALTEPSRAAHRLAAGDETLAMVRDVARLGLTVVRLGGSVYPPLLAQIPDAPMGLLVRGAIPGPGRRLAVVGSRRCAPASARLAADLSERLAEHGFGIVSGLAEGVDGSAHRGTLRAGGYTVAVLGHGLGHCYPAWHRHLAEQIVAGSGSLIAEYPPDWGPRPHQFPERNRIISGLAEAVLVVEASARSGSLITARLALEQGRDVLAVPGSVAGGAHAGCHRLLRDGAALVESPADVLIALGVEPLSADEPVEAGGPNVLSELERRALSLMATEARTPDHVIEALGRPASEVMSLLTSLELKGFVQALDDGYIRRPF